MRSPPPRVSSKRIEPPQLPFTTAERALIARLNTPAKVQRWLNALPYNTETGGETLRSFRPVARLKTAHCCEAALFAAVAITFIYTRCPLSQFCPLIDRRFAEVQALVAADPDLAGKVRLLSISFDPQFDRAEALRAHARKLDADPAVWRFATADEPAVDRLAAEFGVNVIREKDGTITHNLRTAIVAPSGDVTSIVDNNAWTADELVTGIKHALAAAH